MLLAIDTSTGIASVALYNGEVVAEHTWHAGKNHSVELLPTVQAMMAQAHVTPKDLTGVAAATGPGSFNGLRVGLASAKLLSYTLQIPIVGVGTLEAMAYPYVFTGLSVRPLIEAGQGQVATAVYRKDEDAWQEIEAPRLATITELVGEIGGSSVVCVEVRREWVEELRARVGEKVVLLGPANCLRRAGYLAEVGWDRIRSGHTDDPTSLQALYLRRPTPVRLETGV